MALDTLILVSNPGSASRKYAVYDGMQQLLKVHFETVDGRIMYSSSLDSTTKEVGIDTIEQAVTKLPGIIDTELSNGNVSISKIGLRVVAPSSYFQVDREFTDEVADRLEALMNVAPLHIEATLSEYRALRKQFSTAVVIAVSDSKALANKPDWAMYYGIPLEHTKQLDIKRFGYHGLSLQSAIRMLTSQKMLAERVIICHLGGGASVAAVHKGVIIDSTMGFSPLEGVLMATRSGTIDIAAYEYIKSVGDFDARKAFEYLNSKSGLLGVSGTSSDIRVLLKAEGQDTQTRLALDMYVYKIQQSIGAMAATMGGADSLVFTGTVGERSSEMRQRIVSKLLYLGFALYDNNVDEGETIRLLSRPSSPATVWLVKAHEENEIARSIQ